MLTPRLDCTVDTLETKGKTVIRVLVPRGDDPPYALDDNKIYLREEAETSLAVRDEIVQLVLRGRSVRTEAPAHEELPEAAPEPPRIAEPGMAPAAAPAAPAAPEPLRPPRTGVEVVATEERDGRRYHTVRDLRNGNTVKNVTRASARKLWHYAITEHESGTFDPASITWHGNLGLWKKTHKGGATRYDLVQRGHNGEFRIYYGVTEDGIHGEWKALVGGEEE
jgi:hypothetical protein